MKLNAFQYGLWLLSPVLQLIILLAMMRRRRVGDFPVFFSYILFHLVQFAVSFAAHAISYRAYFYVYWGTEFIDALFGLLVIQEIYSYSFRDLRGLQTMGSSLFRWAAVALALAAVVAAIKSPGVGNDRLIAGLVVSERSINFVQCGLVVLIFALCKTFALTWDYPTFGIALGFLVVSTVSVVATTLRAEYGAAANVLILYGMPVAFDLSVAIWLWYLLRDRERAEANVSVSTQFSEDLHRWNRVLEDVNRP